VPRALWVARTAAVAKFGRRPNDTDHEGFTAPYTTFVERETNRALDILTNELRMTRETLSEVKAEDDLKGWPKT
jgi:hypothetical protein